MNGRLPLVGSLRHVEQFLHDSVGGMCAMHEAYGDCVAFLKDHTPVLFASAPAYNRLLLNQPDVFYLISGLPGPKASAQRQFARGLFGLNGERHQEQRRMIMPPFRKEAVEAYGDAIVTLTEESLSRWRPGQVKDIAAEAKDLAVRITGQLLFGLQDLGVAHAVGHAFEEWLEWNHKSFFAAVLPIDGQRDAYERLLEAAETVRERLLVLLAHKRDCPFQEDVLTLLLRVQAAGGMSPTDLLGHTHTLFNAAYHTTTYALTWALFLLAQHPDAGSRLLSEMETNGAGNAPTLERLAGMTFLDRLVKESLRILPPVAYYPRVCGPATEFGPYALPAGTVVIGGLYTTHHLSGQYADPEQFLPDRWLDLPPRPHSYLPFGTGARMCLGAPFALLMLKAVLATIWERFRLQVVPNTQIDRHATLTVGPRHGIPMMIWRQDGRFSTSPIRGNIHEMVHLPAADRSAAAA